MTKKKNIISVSRRCDIPAYYSEWLNKRLKQGFADYLNPFNKKIHTVSLKKEDVSAFIFWSKNFEPFLKTIKTIKTNYCFYTHFTINNYPTSIEKQYLSLSKKIDTFKQLSNLTSPPQTIWRYDPIILTNTLDESFHLKSFESIAKQLTSYTCNCIISFVSLYKKTIANLKKSNIITPKTDINHHIRLTREIISIAKSYNIQISTCCNDYLLLTGARKAHCIDTNLLKEIYPNHTFSTPPSPSRKECGCVKAIDIGSYNICPHGCIYCYANLNPTLALNHFKNHTPSNTFL